MNEREKLQHGKNRGVLAQQVLDNPAYTEALVIIRADLMLKFENTVFSDSAERDEIWRQMNTLAKIEKQLKKAMKEGNLCESELSRMEKAKRLVGL